MRTKTIKKCLAVGLTALLLPTASLAQDATSLAQDATPFTVPSLHNWKASKGTYTYAGKPDVKYSIVKNKKLGEEGYIFTVTPNGIIVKGQTERALTWASRTLEQLEISCEATPEVSAEYFKTHSKPISLTPDKVVSIPCGTTIDVPEYALRGFMIDCGRKYIPMWYLRELVQAMSYYKMNVLQVHLNDNGFKKYFHNNWDETYAAFRLESELFPELTARDGSYSKEEFRDFIKWAKTLGVEIIPEIDCPAHSLAFTHFRPEFGNAEFGVDHLDLSNPNVIPFLDSLYSEYLGGPDPVFCCPRIHIGTDEYSNKKQETTEMFRNFTNHYIRLVKDYKKTPVVWGSLTWSKGETPVDVDGVLMDMWSNSFAQPDSMKQLGYQMVSIPDGYVYIVPAAGYYYDYLNCKMLYEKWTPAQIGNVKLQEHDPQIEGGMFAVWNDVCGNGISVYDIHHRTMPALLTMAQKTWSATSTTMPYQEWDTACTPILKYGEGNWGMLPVASATSEQVKPNGPVQLYNENKPVVMKDLGYPYTVEFTIDTEKESRGTILTQSEFGEFYLSDPVTGRLGFVRDGYLFSFDYSLRPNEHHTLGIKGTNKETALYVDGKLMQTLGYDEHIAADKKPYNVVRTMAFPLQKTGNFKSKITKLTVTQK